MRFKAKLSSYQVQLLHNLIHPISRLAGTVNHNNNTISIKRSGNGENAAQSIYRHGGGGSIVYLDPEHLRISTKAKSGGEGDGIICFAELTAMDHNSPDGGSSGIFLEHRIESAADNVIVFEIDLTQLKMALHSILEGGGGGGGRGRGNSSTRTAVAPLHNSNAEPPNNNNDDSNNNNNNNNNTSQNHNSFLHGSVIILKLAKRNGLPCLCLDSSTAGGSVDLHHAIPVRIMRADEMQYHLPPQISMPDVQLELPCDRPLKTVIERLRAISPQGKLHNQFVYTLIDSFMYLYAFRNDFFLTF